MCPAIEPSAFLSKIVLGVKLKVFGYPTPPPSNTRNPEDSMSYNFTVVEQVVVPKSSFHSVSSLLMQSSSKLEWAFFLMQILSMGFTKLSFVFFFRRIFITGQSRSAFAMTSLVVVAVVMVWATGFFLWFMFSCGSSFTARWTTVRTLHAECPTDIKSDLALAISDFITDVMIMALPIPMVSVERREPRLSPY